MKKLFASAILLLVCSLLCASPQKWTVEGIVTDAVTGEPLEGVVVNLEELWSVTGKDGHFSIPGVQQGRYSLSVKLLGYVDYNLQINVERDIPVFKIKLRESSLALEEVVVTAQRPKDGLGTSHNIGRDALNHLQLSNVTDMSALLPGGTTVNPDLTKSNTFFVRNGGSKAGNAAFSTAVEVDGVRMGNNAAFGEPSGVDTRNISVDNIESVEVISGVASAEYGDLGSGMVKINTKRGRTPVNLSFSVNPRMWQASVSKGIGLGSGVLNVSGEWANATKKLISPYESYTRRGLSAVYSNTFAEVLRFEAGIYGNIGGMNSKDDPDAFTGEFTKENDNVVRANTSLTWLLNRNWVTNIKFTASASYNDRKSQLHKYYSSSSNLPAVHSEEQGYHIADRLPLTYFSDKITDSKELDFAAALKYTWNRRFGTSRSALKAGVQWKANGNAGSGEYYEDVALAANGYRPRPYSDYPFMHNIAAYAEEDFTFPFGLQVTAGIRMENIFLKGSRYRNLTTFSPRFNARWQLGKNASVRAGWGISEKLPSFYVLYPLQEYRDIQTYSFSHGNSSSYIYYTQPFSIVYNPDLKWQRTQNAEVGFDLKGKEFGVSVTGFFNRTDDPYKYSTIYTPFTYSISQTAAGFTIPDNPEIKTDNQTGTVYIRSGKDQVWTPMETKVVDKTFVKTKKQDNGAPVLRAGSELIVDFPEIKPVRTTFRLDAAYTWTYYNDTAESFYYKDGWSHTSEKNKSYQYVGIYANGGGNTAVISGEETHNLKANLTSITHIPQARLIITLKLELAALTRSRNIAAGGTDRLLPVSYMTDDGRIHPFTDEDAANPEFASLIHYPSNDYVFLQDGYAPYAFANFSITKEIGKHVSLSFFANNFTFSRPYVTSMATGVAAVFTPDFYYGLTCRIKL